MGNNGTEDRTAWTDVQAMQLFPIRMERKVSNCIGQVSYGQINYSFDVLVCCEHDGTDNGMASPVIR